MIFYIWQKQHQANSKKNLYLILFLFIKNNELLNIEDKKNS